MNSDDQQDQPKKVVSLYPYAGGKHWTEGWFPGDLNEAPRYRLMISRAEAALIYELLLLDLVCPIDGHLRYPDDHDAEDEEVKVMWSLIRMLVTSGAIPTDAAKELIRILFKGYSKSLALQQFERWVES